MAKRGRKRKRPVSQTPMPDDPTPPMVKAVWDRLGGTGPVNCSMVARAMRAAGYDIADATVQYWHDNNYVIKRRTRNKPGSLGDLKRIRDAALNLSVPGALRQLEINVGALTQNPMLGVNDLVPPRSIKPMEEIIVGPIGSEEERRELEQMSDAQLALEEARHLKVTSILLMREVEKRKSLLLNQDPAALGHFMTALGAVALAGTKAMQESYEVLSVPATKQIEHRPSALASDDPLRDELEAWGKGQ